MTATDTGVRHGPVRLDVRPRDVVRGTRYGNRTPGNYVVDAMARITCMGPDVIAVYAHREHGGGRGGFMLIDARTARVIRSYR